MDQQLKQRLVGAIVLTLTAAIFLPLAVDERVDQETITVDTGHPAAIGEINRPRKIQKWIGFLTHLSRL